MISKAFQKLKSTRTLIIGAVCLLALVLLTAAIAWRVAGANNNLYIQYVYSDPQWADLYNPRYDADSNTSEIDPLFVSQNIHFPKNPGGSATLVGASFSTTFSAAVSKWNFDVADQLDDETFYLDTPGDGQGLQWAYTFTGWHIVADGTEELYIPMETVFQPGDVIPKAVLDKYAANNSSSDRLVLEPLWARCIFVQGATSNGASTGATDGNYNHGNDPKTPVATIRRAFNIRHSNTHVKATVTDQVSQELGTWKDYNAYSHAIMLTGDITETRTASSPQYGHMFGGYVNAFAATFKSLQATRTYSNGTATFTKQAGLQHTMNFSYTGGLSNEFHICGSMRFDNINYVQSSEVIFELRNIYDESSDRISENNIGDISKNGHYFETTSRFSTGKTSSVNNNLYIRAFSCEKVVLNGGTYSGVYVGWTLPELYSQDVEHTWYFGRNVNVDGNVMLGLNNPEADLAGYSSNDRVIITGGKIKALYGAGSSIGTNTAVTGNRNYILYGDDEWDSSFKPSSTTEYDPVINFFYGGGENFKLNGDITVEGYTCSNLGEFYGGGKNYPAVVTGNITATFDNCDFSKTVSGGGKNADTIGSGKGNVTLKLLNGSSAAANVYGSGMGSVDTFNKVSEVRKKPSDWDVAPTGFPAAEKQSDGAVWILSSIYKRIATATGGDLRYQTIKEYSYLSTAKANSATVEINNSTVGGNVYGGGYYSSVLGNTKVTITGSSAKVSGLVFGGSDASTQIPKTNVYKPITGTYAGPTSVNDQVNRGTLVGAFTWVNNSALLNTNSGLDLTGLQMYTDAIVGEVRGSTNVTINSATVDGNIYGGGNAGPVNGDITVAITSATLKQNVFGGCNKANVGGKISLSIGGSTNITFHVFGGNNEAGSIDGPITVNVSGGTIQRNVYGVSRTAAYNGTSTLTMSGGSAAEVYGGGYWNAAGDITVNISGTAEVRSYLFGGCDGSGTGAPANITTAKSVKLNIDGGNIAYAAFGGGRNGPVLGDVTIKMSGGTISPTPADQYADATDDAVRYSYGLFGGGYSGAVGGNTNVSITGGTVRSCVFGGGERAVVTGTTTVSISGGTHFSGTGRYNDLKWTASSTFKKNGLPFGVYGGGYGDSATVAGTTLNFSDSAQIASMVFGGGFNGPVLGDTHINTTGYAALQDIVFGGGMKGAVNGSTYVDTSCAGVHNLFAGGYSADVGVNTNITVNGGTIDYHVYGGNQQSGDIGGNSYVTINSGTIKGYVLGGGQLATTDADTFVTVNGGSIAQTREPGKAGVYGGGYQASVGNTKVVVTGGTIGTADNIGHIFGGCYGSGANAASTDVTVTGGNVSGDLYGGGYSAKVTGSTTVKFSGGSVRDFFGGGNAGDVGDITIEVSGDATCNSRFFGGGNAASSGNVNIVFRGGSITENAFGGGSNETVDGSVKSTDITIYNGNFNYNLFGGGQYGDVEGDCVMRVYGGKFYSIHGASDASASSVAKNVTLIIDDNFDNTAAIEMRDSGSSTDTVFEGIYGGSLRGTVHGNIDLTIKSGNINYVYGGNNTSGDVNGNITVNVEGGTIGELYGGGSKAHINSDTTDSMILNIKGGTIGKGFGGGMLAYTAITPKVTVTGGNITALYGGGCQAATVGSDVTVNNGTIGRLYGGGYAGAVTDTKIVIDDSASNTNVITINGNVYGGGEGISATVNNSTSVTINTDCSFTATEQIIASNEITPSGAVETQITNLNARSRINGSVYGGGDLGRVGEGIIYVGGESAHVANAGKTNVLISNGYIGGNVFAGGRGIPSSGSYDVTMGVVFGSTNVTVNGGYIAGDGNDLVGNVYGGGEQSRVYSDGQATNVVIQEVSARSIAIKGSVFGGGDRGEAGATNASVPTVIGDTNVLIAGYQPNVPSKIYFLSGGVYGDGNLCLVKGERTITLQNFEAEQGKLKTFFSLQRADVVTMNNSAVVLRGAIDKVAEDDEQVYSINRVGHLQMTRGSTVKLEQVVKFLGELSSDVHNSNDLVHGKHFIHMGNNGTNNYTAGGCTDKCLLQPLTADLITQYRNNQIHNGEKNVVCVANGLYLEVKDETGKYGPVTGLFTLQLLYANPGEGGGFVYGSIPESTGDFICETHKWDYNITNVDSATFNSNASKKYYVRVPGNGYELAPNTYDADTVYYTATESSTYMDIIDNVGGYRNSEYSYYYWYIGGTEVRYDISITGYLGTGNTSDQATVSIQQHAENISYVLYGVEVNDSLTNAVSGATPAYVLAENADSLTGNQIAIEIKLGNTSLGFLTYDNGTWKVGGKAGYRGTLEQAWNNVLLSNVTVDDTNDTITWVLHKAAGVNVVTRDMAVFLDIDKFEGDQSNFHNVTTDSANLSFSTYISVVRLLPTQYMYHDNLRSYTGIGTTSPITITGKSCFTVEYQTNYIPAAFPKNGKTMSWALVADSTLPAKTKITMVDLSGDIPSYYYYICDEATANVDLTRFMQMGTKTTIADLAQKSAFYAAYDNQTMGIFNERLLFVFDFEQAQGNLPAGTFTNSVTLQHLYEAVDIMTHDKDNSEHSEPKSFTFNINKEATGLGQYTAAFDAEGYADNGDAVLNVSVQENAEWINTWFREYGFAIEVQLSNASRMPSGMYISYMGQKYYPGADGKTISVPIYEFGDHTLEICNPHGGLAAVLSDGGVAKYNINFFCAPDAKYHINMKVNDQAVQASYTVAAGTVDSLQVIPPSNNGSIVNVGDHLNFNINTDTTVQTFALFAETVEVQLLRKIDGEYTAVQIGSVFSGVDEMVRTGTQRWLVTGGESGTYRIVFNYKNNTEYLNFIIP